MAALLSDEELATITLKSSFVYEYGDMPYFRRCLNEFPLQFFARYRANKDDPSQHRWSRILEVVHRQSGSSNNNGDVAAASATTAPLKWKEKQFLIALRVEGEDKCVELPRLSSKLPAAEEVMAYCARRAEQQLHTANGNDEVLGADARAQLPSAQEIQKMKAFRHGVIVNHQWTPEEVAAAREQNERIGRVGAGSAPVRLTVTSLHNMRLETELGIASSRHMTGPTAMALERRSGSDLALHSGRRAESPAALATPRPSERDGSMWPSQTSSQGGWGSGGASLADLTAAPSPLLSQELQQRWEESKRDAESFYAYVSNEHRSAYMTKVARITLKNFEENKRDRLRGIANEKRLDRKGNLLESGGLWIVDDQLRAQLARKYQMEQDGEVTATTAASGDAKKGGGETPGDDATARDTASAPVSEEEAMLQRFMAQRKSQELSFASVPEEFMSIDDDVAVKGAQDGGDETPRLRSTARSPELLLLCSTPRIVASQLLHHAASSTVKRSLSSSCASLDVLGHSQGDVITTSDEPPRKMARHAYRQK